MKYPVKDAMKIAKQSFRSDILAGFDYLHVDPTKCPFSHTLHNLCDWTVELIEFCEMERKLLTNNSEIYYEVGAEDIQGKTTSLPTFKSFLKELVSKLTRKKLPLPTYVVAQTGTLVKMNKNVGHFDVEKTKELVKIAGEFNMKLKEHNTDYLNKQNCQQHPIIGVGAANIAPEFGLVETIIKLSLETLEKQLVDKGLIAKSSNLREILITETW